MGIVVKFPPKRPPWLFVLADRLMVGADRDLRDLHAMACRVGCTRADFFRGSHRDGSLPYYHLSPLRMRIVERTFGVPLGPQLAADVAAYCFRPRRTAADEAKCGQ